MLPLLAAVVPTTQSASLNLRHSFSKPVNHGVKNQVSFCLSSKPVNHGVKNQISFCLSSKPVNHRVKNQASFCLFSNQTTMALKNYLSIYPPRPVDHGIKNQVSFYLSSKPVNHGVKNQVSIYLSSKPVNNGVKNKTKKTSIYLYVYPAATLGKASPKRRLGMWVMCIHSPVDSQMLTRPFPSGAASLSLAQNGIRPSTFA